MSEFERIVRTRPLTPAEAERDREIRRQVEAEFPPAIRVSGGSPQGLSEALRNAMRGSQQTPEELAALVGVSPVVLTAFLAGQRDLRLATADKLAEVLGLTLSAK